MNHLDRRQAAYAAAAQLHRNEATKRAALMVIMGDHLGDGPAPVRMRDILGELQAMGVAEFDGALTPNAHPERRAMVYRADKVLARLVRDGYLTCRRPRRPSRDRPAEPYTWDLGPATLALVRMLA